MLHEGGASRFNHRLISIDIFCYHCLFQRLADSRVGRAFLDSTHMLLAFETYCVNQSTAALLVDQITQERDLFRVFLDQLQKERPSLRKMDLKAFLMLPVQRVTKLVYTQTVLKPGFHYPSWRPKLTGDRFPLPVNTARLCGPGFRLPMLIDVLLVLYSLSSIYLLATALVS